MGTSYIDLPVSGTNAAGAAVDASGLGSPKTIIADGTIKSGAITVEFSNQDVPTKWAALRTFTSQQKISLPGSHHWIRTRRAGKSPEVSDAPSVRVGGPDYGSQFTELAVPAAAGAGAWVDTSGYGESKTIQIAGSFNGAVIIEASDDMSNVADFLVFTDPGAQTKVSVVNYMRARRVGPVVGDIAGAPSAWLGAANGDYGVGGLLVWSGGRESWNDNATPLLVGAVSLNGSDYGGRTVTFKAVAAMGNAGITGYVKLINVTDASDVATLAFDSQNQTLKETTIALAAGAKIYEVEIYLAAAPGTGDTIELYSAFIEVK